MSWPGGFPLTDDELRVVLGRRDPGGLGREPVVTWRSSRPMSAAALVRHGNAAVFVKRHYLGVRTAASLAAEHSFAGHLRDRGLPVPAVLRLPGGETVLRRGEYCYEAHQVAGGIDVYREAPGWPPYASLGHAYAAGAALARLHLAAADFGQPARPPAVLMNSCHVITAPDPLAAAGAVAGQRPALAVIGWPALHRGGTAAADRTAAAFLLDGYQTVRPLTGTEAAALPLLLPVSHVEHALSVIDYFTSVAVSAAGADLAYEYLIGHAWWFGQPPGAALLGFLAGYLRR